MFNVKLRIVDTAGIEDFEEDKKKKDIENKTIEQTRKALIFSDLALFLIDARQGVTFTDIKLAQWLNKIKKIQNENSENSENNKKNIKNSEEENTENKNNKENYNKNNKENENFYDTREDENGKITINLFNSEEKNNKKNYENPWNNGNIRENFYKNLKKIKEFDEIKIPEIKLIANKVENDFIPDDVYCDFNKLKLGEPIFISAEHGDNMVIKNI
jgi:predicted GTPase